MKIELGRIQTADHKHLPELFALYLESFPREERRELNALLAMMDQKSMFFSEVLFESETAGMVVYWEFDDFLYIEHLAIISDQRGKGIGSSVLKELQGKGYPVLLEVEIPHDEESSQRVTFYNRSGFNALPVAYFQPPYREAESLLPMMLFSDYQDWETEKLRRCIELFHYRVYNFRHKG
jgi:ribosomal protein S18 acetylase RimI-like enzyme